MRFLVLFLLMTSSMLLQAQQGKVKLEGLVYGNNGLPMGNVQVELSNQEDEVLKVFQTQANGMFEFNLVFDQCYNISVAKENHVPMRMIFDTRGLSETDKAYSYEFVGFRMTLREGDDQQSAEEIAHIKYDPSIENFKNFKE